MHTWGARFHAGLITTALCLAPACADGRKSAPAPNTAAPEAPAKPKPPKPKPITYREVPAAKDALSCPECNVILISIDTLRADHLGTYGYARKTSPNLDGFARHSLVFENAISQSSWTTPAHASMFTGLLPSEHGLVVYPEPGKLDPGKPTLAGTLKAKGYATAAFVGGDFLRKAFGLDAGFDTYKQLGSTFAKTIPAARKWLGQHGDKPFFLFLHGSDPHRPYKHKELNTFHKPAQEYDIEGFCRYESRVREGDELQYVIAQYDAGIVYTDDLVGKFLKYLDKQKLLRNTIVIVTADHGEELFDHGRCDHKHSLYRELTRVPLIVHLPSKLRQRVERPVAASLGLLPTITGMLGLDVMGDPARDLRSAAAADAQTQPVISETGYATLADPEQRTAAKLAYYKRSVTTDEWKLIFSHTAEGDSYELYDAKDTAETQDLAKQRAPIVKQLRKALFAPAGQPVLPAVDPTLTKRAKQPKRAAPTTPTAQTDKDTTAAPTAPE